MNRVDWIDIAKGLGMLAVVWGHICCEGWSNDLVYSFHIPLFFFLSGLVFNGKKHRDFFQFLKNRARRLLLPYFIYSVITWLFWVLFTRYSGKPCDDYLSPLLQTFVAQGSGGYLVHNVALWFIPCLFCVELIFYPIGKCESKWVRLFCCIAIAGIGMILEHTFGKAYLNTMPWNLDSAFMAMPFYCVGNMVGINHTLNIKVQKFRAIYVSVVGILTVVLLWSAVKWGAISMGHSKFGNEYIFHVRGLIGCFSTLIFSMLLAGLLHSNKIWDTIVGYVKWVGKYSFDFMATNNPLKGVVCVAIASAFHIKTTNASFHDIYTSLFAFAITLIINSIIVWMISKVRSRGWNLKKQTV